MKYLKHKPGSIEELVGKMNNIQDDSEYQKMFKKELEKAGKGIGAMTPAEKKAFFNKIDSKYSAKNEGLEEIEKEIKEALGYGAKLQKVYVKRDGSDFNVFYRGRTKWGNNKQIGYFHRIPGGKLSVYHDNKNDEDDFTQNDLGYTVQKAIGIIFDTADDNGVIKEAKVDELTKAQEKLPPALQKAIKDKEQKEELDKDDTSAVKKVKDMLKKASQAHAGQAKELDKALKEKDSYGNEINKAKHAAYKDPKRGEHKPVDPKPSLKSVAKTVKEMMKRKKDDVSTMADTEKDKEKKTTLVGSKKTPVDTKPEVEYKN